MRVLRRRGSGTDRFLHDHECQNDSLNKGLSGELGAIESVGEELREGNESRRAVSSKLVEAVEL